MNGVTAKHQECDRKITRAGPAFTDKPLEVLQANFISAYEKELVQINPVHVL